MTGIRSDRLFFYILLVLVIILTLTMVWGFLASIVLALVVSVVLHPMHDWFLKRVGGRKGPATALTLVTTLLLVVIPVLVGTWLLFDSFVTLSRDVSNVVQDPASVWKTKVEEVDQLLAASTLAERLPIQAGQITDYAHGIVSNVGMALVQWLAATGLSLFNMIIPMIVFISLLGTLLTNHDRAVKLLKQLSPLDDSIDELFLKRMSIMTKAMMSSIVVVAIVQGGVTGLIMALGGTPHIIPLTILAMILSILPGGAAIISIPVGLAHILAGNTWSGVLIILGTVTLVASLDNQVRPLLVSKDAYLNRAFVLLSVFSGIAVFGFMGVVYGPLIMILFTTTLEVYLTYFRPGPPSVTTALPDDESSAVAKAAPDPT